MALIPATILTGFLGSGKTTLLKRVLTEAHGQKIAVIENEFGEENIDNEILVQASGEQIIQLNNGCVCCSIREDLRTTLADLAARRRSGEIKFDRVVIETTGLADPGPVAQTFFMDDEIAESYLLDSVLTLVDAKHAGQQLDSRQEARIEVVINGRGLELVRVETSAFAGRIQALQKEFGNLTFAACQNTIDRLRSERGILVRLLPGVIVIDSGVVELMRRQSQGWTYLRV